MGRCAETTFVKPMNDACRCMVFTDFDGTITVNETFRKVLHAFVPERAQEIMPQLDAGTMTLREGVTALVAAIPSDQRRAIIEFTAAEPLRPGFGELTGFLAERRIPLVVVSSGLGFYIEARLAPWRHRIQAVHALDVDCSGPLMALRLAHDHPREAMPKAWILRSYETDTRIAIGDALSDFEMVEAADRVFARDRLLQYLRENHRAVTPFEDFFDIIRTLQENEEDTVG